MFDFVHVISKKGIPKIIHNDQHDKHLIDHNYKSKRYEGINFQSEVFLHTDIPEEDCAQKDNLHIFLVGTAYTNKNFSDKYSTKQMLLDADSLLRMYEEHKVDLIKYIKGVFVIFIADEKEHLYYSFVSRSGLYKCFYYQDEERLIISTSISSIINNLGYKPILDEIAIIQQDIFENTLGDRTHYKDIKILDNYSYIKFDLHKFEMIPYFSLSDTLSKKTSLSWKNTFTQLPIEFNQVMDLIIPKTTFNSALTGGYDSRTILSYFLKKKKNFFLLYSWAADEKWHDVSIAKDISNKFELNYQSIELGDEMLKSYDYFADQQVYWTDGFGSISRSNQMYSHSILAKHSRYLFTGYFGSEIFRPLHRSNVMLKEVFIDILLSKSRKEILEKIYAELGTKSILKKEFINKNREEFFETTLSYFKSIDLFEERGLKIFHYILKTGFWKFFGQEFHAQRINSSIQSPYIDDDFIDFVIKSPILKIHKSAYKRNLKLILKSQAIYHPILKNNFPALMNVNTNRGFKPKDFESIFFPLNIISKYYFHRKKEKKLGVVGFSSKDWNRICFKKHREVFKETGVFNEIQNINFSQNELAKHYSIRKWLNNLSTGN